MDILDEYVMDVPSHQHAIDLFKGEWVSRLPGGVTSGRMQLFSDSRIKTISAAIGGFTGKRILELGPFEGAHAAMMHEMGAKEVLSVEANSRAFLRCLIVKEVLGLDRVRFMLGDFNRMLPTDTAYDFILASGVLYHAKNPVETIFGLAGSADTIGIWSHYYSKPEVEAAQGEAFDHKPVEVSHNGVSAVCYKKDYGANLKSKTYCGGGNPYALWMDRESWFSVFDKAGFELEVLAESRDHTNGPELTAVARRKGGTTA